MTSLKLVCNFLFPIHLMIPSHRSPLPLLFNTWNWTIRVLWFSWVKTQWFPYSCQLWTLWTIPCLKPDCGSTIQQKMLYNLAAPTLILPKTSYQANGWKHGCYDKVFHKRECSTILGVVSNTEVVYIFHSFEFSRQVGGGKKSPRVFFFWGGQYPIAMPLILTM